MNRRRRIRGLLLAAVALVAIALPLALYSGDVLENLELDTVDLRFALRGDEKPPSDLVVVGVDAESLNELNQQWPFPRDFHARVIDRLRRDGAKVIAFDIAFSQPSREPKKFCNFAGTDLAPDDCELLVASSEAKNLVFSAVDVGEDQAIPFIGFEADA